MINVVGIPFDNNSSFMKGPAKAPARIREAFHSESANYFTESGIDLKDHPGWRDEGDFVTDGGLFARISTAAESYSTRGDKLFSLGGDHSITFPLIEGIQKAHSDLTIVHVDAHGDLYHDFGGNPLSHASPFARIMEQGLATRLVQVGIRTMTQHQREQAGKFGVEVFEMKSWDDAMQLKLGGATYLSFDIDVIDPAFAPGVSHHEPGGITSRQALAFLQNLRGNFVGADLVEFNPDRDPSGITAMLAGKLFKEILDLLLRS